MPNARLDLSSIDYSSLSPRQREEVRREATRRAYAERAAMMDRIFTALPRLIAHAFKRLKTRKRVRPVTIPGRSIARI